ncbi:MAG: transposase [Oscillatoria sp. SIO1A7]|nr:transposase [Oscillatoria sp. SIO1A7]
MTKRLASDYDSAWKEALTYYFELFMFFCFRKFHKQIDWSRGYETLDSELQELIADAQTGRRLAGKLVKVWLLNGTESLLLIHVEVQGQYQADFAKRMFIYNSRLFDRYDLEVISLAVLADDSTTWLPNQYKYRRLGFKREMNFPVVKLLDYQWSTLEKSDNPFAIVIMAHLKSMATLANNLERKEWKLRLVRLLFERGYDREQIRNLFRFIEWMMALPQEIQQQFKIEVKRLEDEKKMPFITSFERDGIQQGTLQTSRNAIRNVLEVRFSTVPDNVMANLNGIEDAAWLEQLLRRAVTVASLEAFDRVLASGKQSS